MESQERVRGEGKRQQGFVLIMIVLLILPLLLLAGSAMSFLTSNGRHTQEVVDQACALQAVEAAIDFAVYRGNTGVLPTNLTGSGTLSNGATWTSVGPGLPFEPSGLTDAPHRKAFYAWYFTCNTSGDNAVQANSIVRLASDTGC